MTFYETVKELVKNIVFKKEYGILLSLDSKIHPLNP